jgi:hypothetical protein
MKFTWLEIILIAILCLTARVIEYFETIWNKITGKITSDIES